MTLMSILSLVIIVYYPPGNYRLMAVKQLTEIKLYYNWMKTYSAILNRDGRIISHNNKLLLIRSSVMWFIMHSINSTHCVSCIGIGVTPIYIYMWSMCLGNYHIALHAVTIQRAFSICNIFYNVYSYTHVPILLLRLLFSAVIWIQLTLNEGFSHISCIAGCGRGRDVLRSYLVKIFK